MAASKSHTVLQLHDYLKYFTAREEALFECNECGHLTVQLLKLIVDLFTQNISTKYTQKCKICKYCMDSPTVHNSKLIHKY